MEGFQFIVPLNVFTIVQCIEAVIDGLTGSLTECNANMIHNSIVMFYSTLGTAPGQQSYFLPLAILRIFQMKS
jgi:hypothetical protein